MGKELELSDEDFNDFNYNCLAYAFGDQSQWWEPDRPGCYWPPGFPKDITVPTVESIIRVHGYTVEVDFNSTPKTAAVAIYSKDNEWTHFAKFFDGQWRCKLGEGHDISGMLLQDIEGTYYGNLFKVLSRPVD